MAFALQHKHNSLVMHGTQTNVPATTATTTTAPVRKRSFAGDEGFIPPNQPVVAGAASPAFGQAAGLAHPSAGSVSDYNIGGGHAAHFSSVFAGDNYNRERSDSFSGSSSNYNNITLTRAHASSSNVMTNRDDSQTRLPPSVTQQGLGLMHKRGPRPSQVLTEPDDPMELSASVGLKR